MSEQKPATSNNIISQYDSKHSSNSSEGAARLQQSSIRRVQNVLLIWLDKSIDINSSDCQNTIRQLRCIVNTINTFTDSDQCIQFLESTGEENICMIISGALGQHIVPRIHGMSQVNSIFIFSDDKNPDEQWAKEWSKIKGIFKEIALICEALKQSAQECERNAISISFVTTDGDVSSKNLNQLDFLFIYSQICKEISLTIQYKRHLLNEFVRFCCDTFSENDKELENIKKFKKRYRDETPIWWYTYECFLYPMLNRAIRKMDMDIIVKIGFFIGDLHRHVKQLHSEQFNRQDIGNTFMVYRGQVISKTNFEQMTKTKGGLLSFNNFLYTSKDRDVSLDFARHALENPDLVGILFVMTIDTSKSTTPFACINNVSCYKYKEDEILFSMHTVFRICDIKPMDEHYRLFQVDLTLTNDDDNDLRILTDHVHKETFPQKEGWQRMGLLLLKIGQLDKAQQVYQILAEQTTNDSEKVTIYGQLALAKSDKGEYKDAITFYEKSLEIYKKVLPSNYPHMAGSCSNIGNLYYQMGEYSEALSSYGKALEIQQQLLPPNHPDLGLTYSNIGLMFGKMGQYSKALPLYERALEIQQKSLPPNHLDLAASYNNIGAIYDEMREYSKALWFYANALAIRRQSLSPNHSALGISYSNIGNVYHSMGQYSKALSYYEAAIKIQQISLSPNHPDLASSYNKLGAVCEDMGNYSKARSSYEKALEIRQQSLAPNHLDLASSQNNIGNVYFNMEEYSKALSSYEEALEIRQQLLPTNHSSLGGSFNNIGAVYDKMGEYAKALSFYEKALAIRIQSLPPNHPDLALSYSNIGVVYDKIGEYAKALSSYEKGINIQQQSLPPNHPDLASSYNNIGAMYEDMRNYSQALLFYEKALAIRQQSLLPNHPDLGVSYNNIGVVYHYMKEYSKALSYHEAGIKIQQQSLPPNHPDLASSYNKIGAVYENMGNYSKARSFYEHAVNIGQNSLPSDHPHLEMYTKNLDDITKKL
jgi:tetratricopeptide (TPR) repeat protein